MILFLTEVESITPPITSNSKLKLIHLLMLSFQARGKILVKLTLSEKLEK